MPLFPITSNAATADYLDGAARGELRVVRDTETDTYLEPRFDASVDPERYERVTASGDGTIVSWSVAHGKGADGPTRTLFGIVELAEGPWLWVELRADEPWEHLGGRAVRVAFEASGPAEEHATLPIFIAT
ncbi:Uncharacterized OB-fold protein, contains Zn-ribbon domain [Agrococcus baldri]|uniref:Uncharacterized OB-fold protein, contains Zn-ribbon domain n=1 Tax=Agrococcus baldri TaxID=153730 RepID=A0AA94KZM4_9MICO|nr:OB-fold domain-containing protein [Agrococcus baldri]SFS11498.1 Uncharacterized OB-fold protein, contains Zn-ribbon domain [Agrococcus baldri]